MNRNITQSQVARLLSYNAETGVFTWIKRRCGVRAFSTAGAVDPKTGYIRIKINGALYQAHRLAWLYVHGKNPTDQIDHIDRDRRNNRISNLREATQSENLRNKSIYRSNSSGFRGVHWHKQHRKFAAVISISGRRKHLGLFNTAAEASAAYSESASRLFGEFAAA